MKSYNKVMLLGNLTADPELRSTTTGKSVTTFTLAINRRGKSGEEYTDFHRMVAWSQMADFCCRNLKKGMAIFAVGTLMNHSFEGKNGKQYVTEVVVQDVNILTWKGREQKVDTTEVDPSVEIEEVDVAGDEISATMAAC
jgi:single-strand DNA-binding protein